MQWLIDKYWWGKALLAEDWVRVQVRAMPAGLQVLVRAPWYGDPLPEAEPGFVDKLWEYEVVELFVAAKANPETYVELEFGPGGHYWAARFAGVRRQVKPLSISYQSRVLEADLQERRAWEGEALVAWEDLPRGDFIGNAYSIHGLGKNRQYCAAHKVPGENADFHQPQRFVSLQVRHPGGDA